MFVRLISCFILLASVVSKPAAADEIRVAVASNFAETAIVLERFFEKQTGHDLVLATGSTGKHYAQIQNGAPIDVFLAADIERPKLLEEKGQAIKGSRFTYAIGSVVLWSPKEGLVDSEAAVLSQGKFRHLATANPKLAPYGRAAQEILESHDLLELLDDQIVLGENIAQTFHFIASGNAELGFVSLSQIKRPGKQIPGSFAKFDPSIYDPIEQQAILLTKSAAAQDFLNFLRGIEGKRIIESYGYTIPEIMTIGEKTESPFVSTSASRNSDWSALWLTLRLATISTAILLVVGTPLAWWLVTTRFRFKMVVEAVVALPLVLPPTVLGFYLLIAFGPLGPIGKTLNFIGASPLVFTFSGLVIGSIIYSLPFVVQPLQAALTAVGNGPREAAATLGAGPIDRFFSVILPLARPGFLTATVLGFAHTVGEFGVVLMIGGNIPKKTQVLSISIYDHVEALEYQQAHWIAGGLLVFSFLLLLTVYTLNRKFMTLNRWV